jgi:RloB-like protein
MARNKADLHRRRPTRAPRRRFIIYCEGENTEPAYFSALKRILRYGLIDIETNPVGAPMTTAERAVERAKSEGLAKGSKKPKDSFAQYDQVWAVFDRDEHPKFDAAIALCDSKGVKVGRSNPCFELWLILHLVLHDAPDDRHQLARRLRDLRPEYDPHGAKCCNWDEMIPYVEMAEANAVRLLSRREEEGNRHGRPSTTVGHLTAAIREAAEAAKRR